MTWRAAATHAAAVYTNLALRVRRGMGDRVGDGRFPGRPQPAGIEVEAWGAYAPGDDLRHLDWHALARLDVLLVRRFTAEREVPFDLLVDASASMAVPPPDGKLGAARELALALATIGLAGRDAVRLTVLGGAGPATASRLYRRRASALAIAERLAAVRAGGALDLGAALAAHASRHRRPGAALVISDLMMEPAALEPGVVALRARRWEVVLLHVIGRGELDPGRDARPALLQDVESGATHPVVCSAETRARYRALLDEHLAALLALADRTEARYARLVSDMAVEPFVTGDLARLGLVGRR
jgi:uncharacterized protein (DUF58 family)